MSGIGMAVAAGNGGGGGSPFTVSCSWNKSTTVNVSGASGTCSAAQGVLVILESGGVTPYGQSPNGLTYSGRSSSNIFFAASPDGVHTTFGWSGLAIGDLVQSAATFQDTDSAGTTKTSTSAPVTLHRTS